MHGERARPSAAVETERIASRMMIGVNSPHITQYAPLSAARCMIGDGRSQ